MRRFHWSTILGAVVMGALALLTLGPIAVAALMLRCCSDSTGPELGAWIAILLVLALIVAAAAVVGGLAARLLRWIVSQRR
jgi:ABC-type enterobactin transport system permease subunit